MIGLRESTQADRRHLAECLSLDAWHSGQTPEQWAACGTVTLYDDAGPLFHLAFEDEPDSTVRIHIQFDERVPKRRVVAGLLDAYQKITALLARQGKRSIVFRSVSPDLIRFFGRLGFEPLGEKDDFILRMVE